MKTLGVGLGEKNGCRGPFSGCKEPRTPSHILGATLVSTVNVCLQTIFSEKYFSAGTLKPLWVGLALR